MQKIKVENAVGKILAHDLTKIVPGKFKGAAFKKGHIIKAEDIPELKEMGKEHIYTYKMSPGDLHEDDAAKRLADILQGENLEAVGPEEGKITLKSGCKGLLKVDKEALLCMNFHPEIIVSTLHNNRPVQKEDKVAATRVIPLVIDEDKISEVEERLETGPPLVNVKAYQKSGAGLIVTGNEIYYGRVQDKFKPVINSKMTAYGMTLKETAYLPDDKKQLSSKLIEMVNREDLELVVISGGMSVDPDDITPDVIREAGAEVVTYGTPVLPGAMLMLAYWHQKPIIGLPACAMFAETTAFDLLLPRIAAGEMVTRDDIARLGHGGLCLQCETCRFPNCSFGKES